MRPSGSKATIILILESSPETMLAFLDLLETKYGGVEEYAKQYAHLSETDISTIRANLLVASDPHL